MAFQAGDFIHFNFPHGVAAAWQVTDRVLHLRVSSGNQDLESFRNLPAHGTQ